MPRPALLARARDTVTGKLPDSPLAAVLDATLAELDGADAIAAVACGGHAVRRRPRARSTGVSTP